MSRKAKAKHNFGALKLEQVMQLIGHTGAYSKPNLRRRKQEVLDFIRYGLFADPRAPLP